MLKTKQTLRKEKLRDFEFYSSHFLMFSSINSCFFENKVQKSHRTNFFSYKNRNCVGVKSLGHEGAHSFLFCGKKLLISGGGLCGRGWSRNSPSPGISVPIPSRGYHHPVRQTGFNFLKKSTIDWHCTKPLARNQLGLWFSFLAQPFSTRKHWWILLPSQNLLFRLRWETLELKDFVESTSLNVFHLNWFSEKPFYFYVIVPFLGCLGLIYTSLNSHLSDYPEKIGDRVTVDSKHPERGIVKLKTPLSFTFFPHFSSTCFEDKMSWETLNYLNYNASRKLLDISFKHLQKKDFYSDKIVYDLSPTWVNYIQDQYIGTYAQNAGYDNYLNSSKLFLNLKNWGATPSLFEKNFLYNKFASSLNSSAKRSKKTVSNSNSSFFRTLHSRSKEEKGLINQGFTPFFFSSLKKTSFTRCFNQSEMFQSWWTEKSVSQIYSFINDNSKMSDFEKASLNNFSIWENYLFQKAKIQWFWYKWCPNDFCIFPDKTSRTVWEKIVGQSSYNISRNLLLFFKEKNNKLVSHSRKNAGKACIIKRSSLLFKTHDFFPFKSRNSVSPATEINNEFAQKLFSGNLSLPQNCLNSKQDLNSKSTQSHFLVPIYSQLSKNVKRKLDKPYSFKLQKFKTVSFFLEEKQENFSSIFSNFRFDKLILINGLKRKTNSIKKVSLQLKKDFKDENNSQKLEIKQVDFYGLFGRLNLKDTFNSLRNSKEFLQKNSIKETQFYSRKAYQKSEEKSQNSSNLLTETLDLSPFFFHSEKKAFQSFLDYFTATFFFDNVAERYKFLLNSQNFLNLNNLVLSKKDNKMVLNSKVFLFHEVEKKLEKKSLFKKKTVNSLSDLFLNPRNIISVPKKTKTRKLNFPILLSGYFPKNVIKSQLEQQNSPFRIIFGMDKNNERDKACFSSNSVEKKRASLATFSNPSFTGFLEIDRTPTFSPRLDQYRYAGPKTVFSSDLKSLLNENEVSFFTLSEAESERSKEARFFKNRSGPFWLFFYEKNLKQQAALDFHSLKKKGALSRTSSTSLLSFSTNQLSLINNFLHPDRKRLTYRSNKLKWKSVGNWSFYWNYFYHFYGSSFFSKPWSSTFDSINVNKHSKIIVPHLARSVKKIVSPFSSLNNLTGQNIFFKKWHSKKKEGFFYKRITKLELKNPALNSAKYSRVVSLLWGFRSKYKLDEVLQYQKSKYYQSKKAQQTAHQNIDRNSTDSKINKQIVIKTLNKRRRYKKYLELNVLSSWLRDVLYFRKMCRKLVPIKKDSYLFTRNNVEEKQPLARPVMELNAQSRQSVLLNLFLFKKRQNSFFNQKKSSRGAFGVSEKTTNNNRTKLFSVTGKECALAHDFLPFQSPNLSKKVFLSLKKFIRIKNLFQARRVIKNKQLCFSPARRRTKKASENCFFSMKKNSLTAKHRNALPQVNKKLMKGLFPGLVDLRQSSYSFENFQDNRKFLNKREFNNHNYFFNSLLSNSTPTCLKKISLNFSNKRLLKLNWKDSRVTGAILLRKDQSHSRKFGVQRFFHIVFSLFKNLNRFFSSFKTMITRQLFLKINPFFYSGKNWGAKPFFVLSSERSSIFLSSLKKKKLNANERDKKLCDVAHILPIKIKTSSHIFEKQTKLTHRIRINNRWTPLKMTGVNRSFLQDIVRSKKKSDENNLIVSNNFKKFSENPGSKTVSSKLLYSPVAFDSQMARGRLSFRHYNRVKTNIRHSFFKKVSTFSTTLNKPSNLTFRFLSEKKISGNLDFILYRKNRRLKNKKLASTSNKKFFPFSFYGFKYTSFEELMVKFKNLSSSFVIWRNKFQIRRDYLLLSYIYLDYLGAIVNSVNCSSVVFNNNISSNRSLVNFLSGNLEWQTINEKNNSRTKNTLISETSSLPKRLFSGNTSPTNSFFPVSLPLRGREKPRIEIFKNEQNYLSYAQHYKTNCLKPFWSFSIVNHLKINHLAVYEQLTNLSNKLKFSNKKITNIEAKDALKEEVLASSFLQLDSRSVLTSSGFALARESDPDIVRLLALLQASPMSVSANFSPSVVLHRSIKSTKDFVKSFFFKASLELLPFHDSATYNKNYLHYKNTSFNKKLGLLKNQQKYLFAVSFLKNKFKYRRKSGIYNRRIVNKQTKIYNGIFLSNLQIRLNDNELIMSNISNNNFNPIKINFSQIKVLTFWLCTLLFHVCLISSLLTSYKSSIHFCIKTLYSSLFVLNKYFVYTKYRIKRLITYIYQNNFEYLIETISRYFSFYSSRVDIFNSLKFPDSFVHTTQTKFGVYGLNKISLKNINFSQLFFLSYYFSLKKKVKNENFLTFAQRPWFYFQSSLYFFSSLLEKKKLRVKGVKKNDLKQPVYKKQKLKAVLSPKTRDFYRSSFISKILRLFQYVQYKYQTPFSNLTFNENKLESKNILKILTKKSQMEKNIFLNSLFRTIELKNFQRDLKIPTLLSPFSFSLVNYSAPSFFLSSLKKKKAESFPLERKNKFKIDGIDLNGLFRKKENNLKVYFKVFQWNMLITLLIGESEVLAELEPYREMHWYFLKKFPIFLRTSSGKDYLSMTDYQADEKIRIIKQKIRQTIMILYLRSRKYESKLQNRSNQSKKKTSYLLKTRVNKKGQSNKLSSLKNQNTSFVSEKTTVDKKKESSFSSLEKLVKTVFNFLYSLSVLSQERKRQRQKIKKLSPWKSILTFLGKYSFVTRSAILNKRFRESLMLFSQPLIYFGPIATVFMTYGIKNFLLRFDQIDFQKKNPNNQPFFSAFYLQKYKNTGSLVVNKEMCIEFPVYLKQTKEVSEKLESMTVDSEAQKRHYPPSWADSFFLEKVDKQDFRTSLFRTISTFDLEKLNFYIIGKINKKLNFSKSEVLTSLSSEQSLIKSQSKALPLILVNEKSLKQQAALDFQSLKKKLKTRLDYDGDLKTSDKTKSLIFKVKATEKHRKNLFPELDASPLFDLEFLTNLQKLIKKYNRVYYGFNSIKALKSVKPLSSALDRATLLSISTFPDSDFFLKNLSTKNVKTIIAENNLYDWTYSESSNRLGKHSMYFDTFDPKLRYYRFSTNFSKVLSDVGGLYSNFSAHQGLGPLICKVYTGLFSKQSAKNYLLVSGPTNNESVLFLVQALAAEIGMKVFMEDAKRLQRIGRRGINKATKRLEKLFDIAQANVPALVFIEDIHVIGSKTKMVKVDEEQDDVEILSRSLLSKLVYRKYHKNKSLREAFIDQNLLTGGSAVLRRRSLKPTNPIPKSLVLYQLTRRRAYSNFFKSQDNPSRKINTKLFLTKKLSPAFTTNAVLIWKLFKSKIATPNKRIKESPWFHIPVDAMRSIHPLTYSIRVKVAKITLLAIFTMGTRLRLVKDLIRLFEKIHYNSHQNFIVFATTNKLSTLDPSLRRPGRLEEIISLYSLTGVSSSSRSPAFMSVLDTFKVYLKNVPGFSKTFSLIDNTLFSSNLNLKEWSLINYLAEASYYSVYPFKNAGKGLSSESNSLNTVSFYQNLPQSDNLSNKALKYYILSSLNFQSGSNDSFKRFAQDFRDMDWKRKSVRSLLFNMHSEKTENEKKSKLCFAFPTDFSPKIITNTQLKKQRMTSFETKSKVNASFSAGNLFTSQNSNSSNNSDYWQLIFSNITLQRKKGGFDFSNTWNKINQTYNKNIYFNNRYKKYNKSNLFLTLAYSRSGQSLISFLLNYKNSSEQSGLKWKKNMNLSKTKTFYSSLSASLRVKGAKERSAFTTFDHFTSNRSFLFFDSDYLTNLQLWPETVNINSLKPQNTFYNRRKNLQSYFLRFFSSKVGELLFTNSIIWNLGVSATSWEKRLNLGSSPLPTKSKNNNKNYILDQERKSGDDASVFLPFLNNIYGITPDWTCAYSYIKNVVTTSSLYSKTPLLSKLLRLEDVSKPRQKQFFESLNAGMLFEYSDFHYRAFFKKNNLSTEENLNLLIFQKYMLNNQGRPLRKYVKLESSNRLWLFRILYTELGTLDNISLRPTSMNYYYRNKIILKHLFKLSSYQWWNWHLRKPLEQLEDVQEIAYFPCENKYYNPRHRRWILTNGFWGYWFSFDKNFYFDLYEQYMFQSFHSAYLHLDQNREILDYLSKLYICREKLSETDLILSFKRYKI